MPEARGDIREIVGQPVFVPLFTLYRIYGKVSRSPASVGRGPPALQPQHRTARAQP